MGSQQPQTTITRLLDLAAALRLPPSSSSSDPTTDLARERKACAAAVAPFHARNSSMEGEWFTEEGAEKHAWEQQQQEKSHHQRRLGCHWQNWKHRMVCTGGNNQDANRSPDELARPHAVRRPPPRLRTINGTTDALAAQGVLAEAEAEAKAKAKEETVEAETAEAEAAAENNANEMSKDEEHSVHPSPSLRSTMRPSSLPSSIPSSLLATAIAESKSEPLQEHNVSSVLTTKGGSFCCFAGDCGDCGRAAEAANFCAASEEICAGHCGAVWCTASSVRSDSPAASKAADRKGDSDDVLVGVAKSEVRMCDPHTSRAAFRDITINS